MQAKVKLYMESIMEKCVAWDKMVFSGSECFSQPWVSIFPVYPVN